MLKLVAGAFAAVMTVSSGAHAAVAGADTEACRSAHGPAILIHIEGVRNHAGIVRVQLYGGDPARYFDKGRYIRRLEVPAAEAGEICMPVPKPGIYAISVRHDANGNGKSDSNDGGGMSGNPPMSLFDVLFKRKPDPAKVEIRVSEGVTSTSITLNYVQGGSFKPLATASR
jgi:uncharacterized protein (DUF2141 family)